MSEEIKTEVAAPGRDLSNTQMVGANGTGRITVLMPCVYMTRDEALVHAAWLVLLSGGEQEIGGIIAAIGGRDPQAVSESDVISAQSLHDSPGSDGSVDIRSPEDGDYDDCEPTL